MKWRRKTKQVPKLDKLLLLIRRKTIGKTKQILLTDCARWNILHLFCSCCLFLFVFVWFVLITGCVEQIACVLNSFETITANISEIVRYLLINSKLTEIQKLKARDNIYFWIYMLRSLFVDYFRKKKINKKKLPNKYLKHLK